METFTAYGLEFQKRFVPQLEQTQVTAVDRIPGGFSLKLANGEMASARNVVLAVGISHFHHVPPNLAALPAQFFSHSSAHSSVEEFRGRNVTVLGGGASAADLAAALSEGGAHVTIVARCSSFRFHTGPPVAERSLWERIRRPASGLGPGLTLPFLRRLPFGLPPLAARSPPATCANHVRPRCGLDGQGTDCWPGAVDVGIHGSARRSR